MPGSVQAVPGFDLQPAPQRVAKETNYIEDFNFLNQYLPDVYEQEFERYGNRSVASFLRMVSAEIPSESDLIKWEEQGRLHIKYTSVGTSGTATDDVALFQVNDTFDPARGSIGLTSGSQAIRVGQTVIVSQNDNSGSNKGIVIGTEATNGQVAVGGVTITAANQFVVAFYEAGGLVTSGTGVGNADVTVMVYGSEFDKGTAGMDGSLEANPNIFDNKPFIMKDRYEVSGSDMAQIGWVNVETENGADGYLWYIKSEHETRLRFEDYMETSVIEAVPAETNSGAADTATVGGSEGVFYVVEQRGNVYSGGNPDTLSDWDTIVARLDKQGAIEENVVFNDREFGFDVDDMLAAQNSYGAGGTSYGLFDNSEQMAINLGFTGFRRGYDFYKTDWKYLNDPTMRGDLPSGNINGMMVPAGTTSVYDQVMGKNVKRPFLHVRYRSVPAEDRKFKTWVEGSAGGARTSDIDAMIVNYLTERCVCTLGANNFFLFQD